MLNNKQKKIIKGIANNIKPLFQIGKDGVTKNMLNDIELYLDKNELLKVSILPNCPLDKEEVVLKLSVNNICVVQVIGRTIVLYRASDKCKNPIIFE